MPYKVIAYPDPDETQPELLGVGIKQSAYAQWKMDLYMLVCLSTYIIQNQHDEKHYQDHSRSIKGFQMLSLTSKFGLAPGTPCNKNSKKERAKHILDRQPLIS